MFSSGGTCSAPLAANCIMFDGSLEARIKSIVRGMSLPPKLARKRIAGNGVAARQARRGFQLPNRKFQFSNQPVRSAPKKLLHQRAVVPESSFEPAIEALPDRFPYLAVIGKNGAHIIQFVRGRNQPSFCIGTLQM